MEKFSRDYLIEAVSKGVSLKEETDENWARWIAQPVVDWPIAPREARLVLDVVGEMVKQGHSILDIIGLLLAIPNLSKCGISGAAGGTSLREAINKIGE